MGIGPRQQVTTRHPSSLRWVAHAGVHRYRQRCNTAVTLCERRERHDQRHVRHGSWVRWLVHEAVRQNVVHHERHEGKLQEVWCGPVHQQCCRRVCSDEPDLVRHPQRGVVRHAVHERQPRQCYGATSACRGVWVTTHSLAWHHVVKARDGPQANLNRGQRRLLLRDPAPRQGDLGA